MKNLFFFTHWWYFSWNASGISLLYGKRLFRS
ncbi:putative periplasmic protein [Campylobacter fetus subsp. venerealis NCTC 10354]|nr:putative periplasmic protein [Campylobacter fetus subsp. venerealis NCTC 10354]